MLCDEAQELITGLIDAELTASERAGVEEHLTICSDCRAQFEREAALKREIKLAAVAVVAPQALRAKLEQRGSPVSDLQAKSHLFRWNWHFSARLRPAFALAVVILVVGALWFQWQPTKDLASAALALHQNILAGKIPLARRTDVTQLRTELAQAANGRFAPIALDLSMMKLYPVAGFIEKIAGRDVLVTVYQGGSATITCLTFLGDDSDAPPDSQRLFDPELKINFHSYSRGGLSAVMHREGEVTCLLVSRMQPALLLDVARGRRHHA